MDGLMNRSRGLAEGVVVMVCPALLAMALNKVDLRVYGRRTFMAMLTMAGVTLISGICPVLVCCLSQRFPSIPYLRPDKVTASLASLSCSCLLILACFIAQLIVSKKILITVGTLCGTFVLVRAVFYYLGHNGEPYDSVLHDILDESNEFLTAVTGILFLGLEGLALESHDKQLFQKSGGPVATISFIVCAIGVCLMYFEMIPPQHFRKKTQIVGFTLVLDILMAFGIFLLLMIVMFKRMGIPALVLCTPPAVTISELVYRVAVDWTDDGDNTPPNTVIQVSGTNIELSQVSGKDIQVSGRYIQVSGAASLELTRVTFTGFLAVSITANANTSPSMLTGCFLLFAAAAIVFGLSWRLLTQSQLRSCLANLASRPIVASSAKLASLCTHFCIVIATILFLAMAGTARGK